MQFYEQEDICQYFDVSIIIPVYDDFTVFKNAVTQHHSWFQRNGIEVLVLVNESDPALIEWLQPFYLINWKVIASRRLKAAIQMASNTHVMLLDAGRFFFTDVIYQLRYICEYYKDYVAIAREIGGIDQLHDPGTPSCGSIMANRNYFINKYMDEVLNCPYPEFDHIIQALELQSIHKMWVPQAVLFYEEGTKTGKAPDKTNAEHDQPDIVYDWQTSDVSSVYRKKYLQPFLQFKEDEASFKKEYELICLMQVRNERHHLPEVIDHIAQYCDGVILLDDESNDGSYEAAVSEKLLLKVQKSYKGFFDDLENRNILLQLGRFIKTKWFFFMDADERFDERYADVRAITRLDDIDVACFRLVHLWNNDNYYRKNVPRVGNGLLLRYRMFRNKGFTQIIANRELHFATVPFKIRAMEVKILIKHYGIISEEIRKRKYYNYLQQDEKGEKQGHGYDYLLDTTCMLGKVDELDLQ